MSGSAQTVWPGQEVVQWPGQEVKAGQGEHGYAPAQPESPSNATQEGAIAAGYPEASVAAYFDKNPIRIPLPAAVTDLAAYREPGTDNTDIAPREGAATRIVGAAGEGFRTGWAGRTDPEALAAQEQFRRTPIIGPINTQIEPVMRLGAGLLGAAGGAFGQGAYEIGNLWSPEAGRDAFMAGQVIPNLGMAIPKLGLTRRAAVDALMAAPRVSPMMEAFDRAEAARAEQPSRPRPPDPAESGIARTQAQIGVRDAPPPSPDMTATPAERAPGFVPRVNVDPLTDEVTTTRVPDDLRLRAAIEAVPPEAPPGFVPPGERAPSVPPGAAGPATIPSYAPPSPDVAPTEPPGFRSVGAAASREGTPAPELGLTPDETAAYRSTAEGNKLLEPQEPGVRDDKVYLTGERINEAQASQDVEIARELNSLREQTPALDKAMTEDENHNNNITTNAIHNAIPGQVQITAAKNARKAAMETNEPKVFANAADADVLPIVKEIQDILNEPKNLENSQLKQYVRPLIARLQNPDGTPKITNPLQLWGWRQDVQHLTSGAAQAGDPNLSRISGLLGRVLEKTDDQLETAAPGYKVGLRDEYHTRSREIDAMEALNAERFKLFDSQNKPNYNAVQSLMKRMVDARQANDPYNPFTHVTQDTLDKFWNIRDSMRRRAAVDRLGKPRGSPTSQNVGDALRVAGKMALQTAAPAIGATLGTALITIPGVGPVAGIAAGATLNHFLSARAMGQRLTRGLELTNPNRMLHPDVAP